MEHPDFKKFDETYVVCPLQKISLRDDYILYLEYKVKKMEGREKILLELLKGKQ